VDQRFIQQVTIRNHSHDPPQWGQFLMDAGQREARGDVTFMNAMPEHMSLVFSVPDKNHVTTIDGNNNGVVTGPRQPKPNSSFDGFVTGFPSPPVLPVAAPRCGQCSPFLVVAVFLNQRCGGMGGLGQA
jgi:hypothetical protein